MSLRERYETEVRRLRAEDREYKAEELSLAVSEAIRDRMEAESITQAVLARRLGVSRACVSNLLSAKRCNLTLERLARLAAALNARVAWDFMPLLPSEPDRGDVWDCKLPAVTVTITTSWGPMAHDLALAA
jgi:predicted XRE-type DNA-binding protein